MISYPDTTWPFGMRAERPCDSNFLNDLRWAVDSTLFRALISRRRSCSREGICRALCSIESSWPLKTSGRVFAARPEHAVLVSDSALIEVPEALAADMTKIRALYGNEPRLCSRRSTRKFGGEGLREGKCAHMHF